MKSEWPGILSHSSLHCPQFLAHFITYIILYTQTPCIKHDLHKVDKKEFQSVVYHNLHILY